MRMYDSKLKKHFDQKFRFLLDELLAFEDLRPNDWKEIYLLLLKRLGEFHEKHQVLVLLFKAIEVRTDYITAHRIVGKFRRHFDLVFEKLPGKPAYFVPSEAGMALFELLISPFDRAEVRKKAWVEISTVRQLALTNFLQRSKGVGA